ncbi:MAG TPA: hypothetical protein ENK57_04205 [Polyangiaceae bacterium]|nr:hypothetical protein [Polyangiaceae bacterium]
MPRLDARDLRRYAQRDWGAPERLARRERARLPVDERVRLGIALYEATKATNPGWPDEATRRADLDAHMRVKRLLHEAADVGAR